MSKARYRCAAVMTGRTCIFVTQDVSVFGRGRFHYLFRHSDASETSWANHHFWHACMAGMAAMGSPSSTSVLRRTMDRRLSVAIIGDAFADLYCFLGDSKLPKPGRDARLLKPIRTVAGGSGLNTATHLSSPSRRRSGAGGAAVVDSISLHTVLNESDAYGRLLSSHANEHGFALVNCRRPSPEPESTGHCTVIVSKGERSFMTHLGCVAAFEADHVDVDGVLGSNAGNNGDTSGHDHLHVHVAGYYNIAGFFDGQLKRLLQSIRDRRASKSVAGGSGRGTTISLVPQHDATEQWDGGLVDLLPLVDYLICSEVEAANIANAGGEGEGNDLHQLASFFHRASPNTCVVVTLGARGAVALRDGKILLRQKAPVDLADPVDPTGAGDAFAAGFLHGIHGRSGSSIESEVADSLLRSGLFYGCTIGTSCVMKEGASAPASSEEIDALIKVASFH